jgi:hypothetical protein
VLSAFVASNAPPLLPTVAVCIVVGAREVMAPRLLAAFGSQRDRYGSANEVQVYSGIAPVLEKSGKMKWVHFRRALPK